MAVRAAASLCLHLAPAGGCALHLPGEARPLGVDRRLGGWPSAHARLALVEADDGPPLAARRAHRGLTIRVSALTEPPGARELARIAAGSSHLVAPVEVPSLAPAFSVAGCNGYELATTAGRRARDAGGRGGVSRRVDNRALELLAFGALAAFAAAHWVTLVADPPLGTRAACGARRLRGRRGAGPPGSGAAARAA